MEYILYSHRYCGLCRTPVSIEISFDSDGWRQERCLEEQCEYQKTCFGNPEEIRFVQ